MARHDDRRVGGIDEQLLNAYIDDELGAEQKAQIECQLAQDEIASNYVRNARRVDGLTRAALGRIDDRELSSGLSASLEALRGQHHRPERRPRSGVVPMLSPSWAIAASLLMLAIGYGGGFLTAENRFTQQMLAMEQEKTRAMDEVRVALNRALEYSPSGKPVTWRSADGRTAAELVPIRTLKTEDRRFCREFKEVVEIDGVREERRGLACREGKENWRTRLILADGASGVL